ncbi:MAG: hypothetical protein M3O70_21195 [Actinomycetota bacterium]|nr:hypothetical protein [Actinomycetota bacterium]
MVGRLYVLPVTCTIDGLAHLVTDAAMAIALAAQQGRYPAICGHSVHAAPMACPIGQPCQRCAAHIEPPQRPVSARRRHQPGPGRRRHGLGP